MFTKIHSTTVIVSDQEKALDFYVDTLGWEKRADMTLSPEMRWLTVAPVGGQTELALGVKGWMPEANATRGEVGISLVVNDIDATYKALSEKGVKFRSPVQMMPWGMKATWFSDPDGNEFFLVEE